MNKIISQNQKEFTRKYIKICGGKKDQYKTWSRLLENYPEVRLKCQNLKFPGKGQRKTPICDKETALYIIGLLPGAIGERYREKAANLVRRYSQQLTLDLTVQEQHEISQDF